MAASEPSTTGVLRRLPAWADRVPNESETRLLGIVYDVYVDGGIWPQFANVQAKLDQMYGIELDDLLPDLPYGLLWPDPSQNANLTHQQPLETTLFALTFVPQARADVDLFFAIFRWAVDRWMAYTPPAAGPPELVVPIRTLLSDLGRERRTLSGGDIVRALMVARLEPAVPGVSATQAQPDEGTVTLGPSLRGYRGIETLDDYFARRPSFRRRDSASPPDGDALARSLRDLLRAQGELSVSELSARLGSTEADVVTVLDEYGVGADGTVEHRGKGRGGGWVGAPHPDVGRSSAESDDRTRESVSDPDNDDVLPSERAPVDEDESPAELGVPPRAPSDVAAAVDKLGFAPLVRGLADLLAHPQTTLPLAIAITGEWGAGKSSLMRQLGDVLQTASPPPDAARVRKVGLLRRFLPAKFDMQTREHSERWIVAKFDAWKYEGSDRLWAALTKAIYEAALERETSWYGRLRFKTRLECARQGGTRFTAKLILPFLPLMAGITYVIYTYLAAERSAHQSAAVGVAALVTIIIAAVPRWSNVAALVTDPFKRAIDQYTFRRRFEGALGFTREAERDVDALTACLTAKTGSAIAVFVEDLDRCSPAHVVEVVESVNQIFNSADTSKCLFVFGMDVDVISANITAVYAKTIRALPRRRRKDFGLDYLRKVAQLFVSVPEPSSDSLRRLLQSLEEEAPEGDSLDEPLSVKDEAFVAQLEKTVLEEGPESVEEVASVVKRLDVPPRFEAEVTRRARVATFESNPEDVRRAVAEVVPLLPPNPRALKQFDTAYRLQIHVAAYSPASRLTFAYPQLVALAKWVVLRQRSPALARRVLDEPALLRALEDDARRADPTKTDSSKVFRDPSLIELFQVGDDTERISRLPLDSFLQIV